MLEAIDRIAHKRKQEREHEQMLRAAKSRSKGADPEKAAKIREEAKQVRHWGGEEGESNLQSVLREGIFEGIDPLESC